MNDTFVPTAELKHALAVLCPDWEPDALRAGALRTLMKALGLQTLVADPFDGMVDEQRRIAETEGLMTALANAADKARGDITQIEVPLAATPANWPEDWDSKPFCKVVWDGEEGATFLCVSPDQAGTVLGDFLGGRHIESARARILQSMFLGGLTARELVLHERQNTPLFQQARHYAELALADDLPPMPLGGEPIKLVDYAAACREAASDLNKEIAQPETAELMAEPWLERAKAAEARITAGERYV